jgi:heme/copper-type cytochrome/quinol oxidase subunit 2
MLRLYMMNESIKTDNLDVPNKNIVIVIIVIITIIIIVIIIIDVILYYYKRNNNDNSKNDAVLGSVNTSSK